MTTREQIWRVIFRQWDPAVRLALLVFISTRLITTLIGAVLTAFYHPPLLILTTTLPKPLPKQVSAPSALYELLLGPWQRWDTLNYLKIAVHGYIAHDGSILFPPLYPMLMRILGWCLGGNYLLAGLLISNVCFVGLLIVFYKLTDMEFGPQAATRSAIYLAVFPTAFFLLMAYTESLFLLLVVAAFYLAEQKRWVWVGIMGALASLTRQQGVIVLLPLLYRYLEQKGFSFRSLRWNGLSLGLIPAAALSYSAYQRFVLHDDPLSHHLRVQWEVYVVWPWQSLINALQNALGGSLSFSDGFDLGAAVLFIMLTILALRSLPIQYSIYMIISLLLLLTRTSPWGSLFGFSRYVLSLFPAFMLLGLYGQNPFLDRIIIVLGILLYIALVICFVLWLWVG